jgi:hypothetical protein
VRNCPGARSWTRLKRQTAINRSRSESSSGPGKPGIHDAPLSSPTMQVQRCPKISKSSGSVGAASSEKKQHEHNSRNPQHRAQSDFRRRNSAIHVDAMAQQRGCQHGDDR